ncbi:NADH-quinone oxidoreductase subunit A [Sodalis sp. CWE]|nr:NADH-quinone oxidoreductase subunit A [Sodalis sp. CWE]MBX4181080.1 NADH-quinone oxidoreductase subunit A [Sodalis sp. CWE]
MLMTTNFEADYWTFSLFLLGALSLCVFMLVCGFLLGGRAVARAKHTPFESGIDSVSTARTCFSAKFYLIAMFFVIFDAEALYLYVWAITIREAGWMGFIEISIFITMLFIDLFYLDRIGAFEWALRKKLIMK